MSLAAMSPLLRAGSSQYARCSRCLCVRTYAQAAGAKPTKDRIGKGDLKRELAEKLSISQVKAGEAIDTLLTLVVEHVTAGRDVSIPGFGTFEKRHREAREGVNPRDPKGPKMHYPAKDYPAFAPGTTFKQCAAEGNLSAWKLHAPEPPEEKPAKAAKGSAKK